MDREIELALRTWYDEDHPLHFDPLHPAIGLAGEAGELLDLYKKERFKDGFSWWDCAHCGFTELNHDSGYSGLEDNRCPDSEDSRRSLTVYTPKILDELGDLHFYKRILDYIGKHSGYEDFNEPVEEITILLADLNLFAAQLLHDLIHRRELDMGRLTLAQERLDKILEKLNYTLDQITELNWTKLKDGDNNGWEKARTNARKLP